MPPFDNFTNKAKQAIQRAHELAIERGQNHVNPIHMLAALLLDEDSIIISILEKMDINTIDITDEVIDLTDSTTGAKTISPTFQLYLTPDLAQVIEVSAKKAVKMKDDFVSVEHLFLALLSVPSPASDLLSKFKVEYKKIEKVIMDFRHEVKESSGPKKARMLFKFARNLTQMAQEDKLDPVIGRDREIMRIMQILSRRKKNNPILIGEPGTGKTAIVEGLAIRMAKGDVPESLKKRELVMLDLGLLLAGTKYRGEFEDRLKKIMKEVEQADGNIVLFIDEIHTLVGAGASEGTLDAANMLKPALARGEFRAIGATTLSEYQKHFEKDPALARRFQPVMVEEPSTEDTVAILRGLKNSYELFHGVRVTDDAILSAVELSSRYITNRFLPDKAVDLIDESAASLRMSLENKPVELEESHRKVMRLEIEMKALEAEAEAGTQKAKDRIKLIKKEIADLKDKTKELEAKWINEKEVLTEIANLKKKIAEAKIEANNAELNTDLGKVAEIRYGRIPVLEKQIVTKTDKLKKISKGNRILREEVTDEDIATVVSRWTNIPLNRMLEEETSKLVRMEDALKERVKGQEDAISKITNAIRRSRVGINDPNRPIGSFMFLGPTGVGKTELTKALTEFMFDSEDALIRVDMSEYMEKHAVSKLIGAPPGYVGYDEAGNLTEAIRHRPYSVVLFDEIEKAHPDVFNILLQVLDDGRLTDGKGRVVNFKNTIIVMTSNIGSEFIQKMQSIGFETENQTNNYNDTKNKVTDALKDYFRPEFLNRLDEIMVFDVLSTDVIRSIVTSQISEVQKRLKAKEITLSVSDAVCDYLAEKGYDPKFGARPLRRIIQNEVLNRVAMKMVSGEVKAKDTLVVEIIDGIISIEKKASKVRKRKLVKTG